jgi:hypothetical protein
LGDEAVGCVNDRRCAPSLGDQWSQRQFCASPLMAVECSRVKASFVVKGENVGGGVNSVVIGRFGIRAQKWGARQRRNA